jgi:hypothetical protein
MGKGVAAEFKRLYPDMFEAYKRFCDDGLLEPGKLWLWRGPEQWVLNFPTKKHWRSPSKIEWIEAGLKKFVDQYERQGIQEVAFPKLGCGNGNLDWEEVRPLMEHYLEPLSIPVFIHDYEVNVGLPEHLAAIVEANEHRAAPTSFDEVWGYIQNLSMKVGHEMFDLEYLEPFRITVNGSELLVETDSDRSFVERDEVSDVWRILNSGLLTKQKLGLLDPREASRLISLFCLFPNVRAVSVARPSSEAEVAAEFRFNSPKVNPGAGKEQSEFSWQ